jgi:hypothetical protein
MIKLLAPFLFSLLVSCSNYGQLTFLAKLPRKLRENSGMAILDPNKVWFIEDGRNADKIYEVDLNGSLLREFEVKNAKNQDWEDLAADQDGNVYIADLGNNQHNRDEFVIYKIPDPRKEKGDKIDAEEIRFQYPPKKGKQADGKPQRHDSEAIFYRAGYLFIITKDRSRPFSGEAFIYKVPARKGEYQAQLVGSFTPCSERGICEVTAADISPDGKKIALLGYGMLWVFSDFASDDFTKGKLRTIHLGATTQLESIGFVSNTKVLLSDEKLGATGRNLYSFEID